MKHLNMRLETKTSRRKQRKNTSGHWDRQEFTDQTPNAQEIKAKIDELDFNQATKFLYERGNNKDEETTSRMRGSFYMLYI